MTNGKQPPRTVLEHLLRQRDRTYQETAYEFEKLARELNERGVGISPRHLRRLASGERAGTTPATRRVLQAMFGMTAGELLQPYRVPSEDHAMPVAGRADPRSDVEVLTMAAERFRDFAFRTQESVGSEAVEEVTDEVRELARTYLYVPLPSVLGRLVGAQDRVLSLLELRQRPANARHLYFLATILGGILAYAGDDVGRPDVALSHARTAYMWAEYADHNGLRAWIRGIQSFVCYWDNRPHEAVRYAQAGNQFANVTRSTAAPWLFACEARAHAALGAVPRAKTLIEDAFRAQDQIREDDLDEIGGICAFYPSRLTYYAAGALASSREESALAERYALDAVTAYSDQRRPGWDYSCQADTHISLALSRARGGEIDSVAEALQPVFALPPEQRIHDLVKTINLVHGALTERAPAHGVQDIQEQIELFTRSSLPRFPV